MELSYQIGLDIATAASILAAAYSVIKSNSNARKDAAKTLKKQKLLSSLELLEALARELHHHSIELSGRFASERQEDSIGTDDFLTPCRKIIGECRILLSTSFAVWAEDAEKQIIIDLKEKCAIWNNTFLDDIEKKQKISVKINDLVLYIEEAYLSLGETLNPPKIKKGG